MARTKNGRTRRALRAARFGGWTLLAAAIAMTAACDVHKLSGPGRLARIAVSPNATLAAGTRQQMVAQGYDAEGREVSISPTWSVGASAGTISAIGMFSAGLVAGSFVNTVVASVGDISGRASLIVTAGPLASITLTPNPVTLAVTATQQFVVVGKDAGGNIVPFSPTWSIVAGGGTINQAGMFTANGTVGTYGGTVQVGSSGVIAVATVQLTAGPLAKVTVTPSAATTLINGQQQFTALGSDVAGNPIAIVPTWAIVANGGTIDIGGLFTAGVITKTFAGTVRATSGGLSSTATVTVTSTTPPTPFVDLGTASPNGIMAGTAVTCVTGGIINADVSISPGNTVTGFGPCVITGVQHLGDALAAQGQIDLTTAYNTLAGLPCSPSNAIVGNLGGTTKPAGVYCTASGIGVTGTLTLDGGGDPNATFIFQAGTSLVTAGNVVLINGAQARNVYWQVGSSATIGTSSQWQGNILALTSITLVDNATLLGRALARNGAVSLGTNNVITLP
jgi:Ice-binding-like